MQWQMTCSVTMDANSGKRLRILKIVPLLSNANECGHEKDIANIATSHSESIINDVKKNTRLMR